MEALSQSHLKPNFIIIMVAANTNDFINEMNVEYEQNVSVAIKQV